MIWTDDVLNSLAQRAGVDIAMSTNCVYQRFYQEITEGEPLIMLPEYVLGVMRVSWRGVKLDPISWDDMQVLGLTEALISNADQVEATTGRPLWYSLHPTNVRQIRIYPSPQESFIATGDPYSPTPNEARCSIACYRTPDDLTPVLTIPSYIDRRTRKAFVLWKCFEMEGKGQSALAAAFYKKKYDFLISQFKRITSGTFVSMRYGLTERLPMNKRKWPKPVLPSNFERVDYK